MDILVDSDLKPWLIEMNISPSLHSSTLVDVQVKAPLAKDVLNMCGMQFPIRFLISLNVLNFFNSDKMIIIFL